MHIFSGSLRQNSLESTHANALELAKDIGVTRVTNITYLDKIGIPVYSSIRPTGRVLCVHNGKGTTNAEAKVGAFMEAIEYAYADNHVNEIDTISCTYGELAESSNAPQFEEFCIRYGRQFLRDKTTKSVICDEIISGEQAHLPEELVFVPSVTPPKHCPFGFTTNGLASGNSFTEASIHALCELLERDAVSFYRATDNSRSIELDSLPDRLKVLCEKIECAGLYISLRQLNSEFEIPCFIAHIFEDTNDTYCSATYGTGAHIFPEIAASRAITEAAQSRLTAIHGSRDDLIDAYTRSTNTPPPKRQEQYSIRKRKYLNNSNAIAFSTISPMRRKIASLQDAWEVLLNSLTSKCLTKVYSNVLYADSQLTVVKIIVPGLENFEIHGKRIGPRLWDHIKQKAK